jgi:hypothetical protein
VTLTETPEARAERLARARTAAADYAYIQVVGAAWKARALARDRCALHGEKDCILCPKGTYAAPLEAAPRTPRPVKVKPEACTNCGTKNVKAKGLCGPCYSWRITHDTDRPEYLWVRKRARSSLSTRERFESFLSTEITPGHRRWTGSHTKGYGRFSLGRDQTIYAHRWWWEEHHGPIGPGEYKDCVDHLVKGTSGEVARTKRPGRKKST